MRLAHLRHAPMPRPLLPPSAHRALSSSALAAHGAGMRGGSRGRSSWSGGSGSEWGGHGAGVQSLILNPDGGSEGCASPPWSPSRRQSGGFGSDITSPTCSMGRIGALHTCHRLIRLSLCCIRIVGDHRLDIRDREPYRRMTPAKESAKKL